MFDPCHIIGPFEGWKVKIDQGQVNLNKRFSNDLLIIVNLGEDSGVKIGDKLNIYRGAEYIAGLEVIQVRKDICAADIKSKMMDIEVGDTVR